MPFVVTFTFGSIFFLSLYVWLGEYFFLTAWCLNLVVYLLACLEKLLVPFVHHRSSGVIAVRVPIHLLQIHRGIQLSLDFELRDRCFVKVQLVYLEEHRLSFRVIPPHSVSAELFLFLLQYPPGGGGYGFLKLPLFLVVLVMHSSNLIGDKLLVPYALELANMLQFIG